MRHIILSLVMAVSGLHAISGNIYVSEKSGCDTLAGTMDRPIKTPAEALKRAREWRRLNAVGNDDTIRIVLDRGIYRMSEPLFVRPEDSGSKLSPTVFVGPPDGSAVISGGVSVTGWSRGCDDSRLPAGIRDSVWVADAPLVGNRHLETRQLYVDGKKAHRSTQFAPAEMERMVDFNTTDRTITIPAPDMDLSGANQLEMVVHQRWAIAILRVKDMRPDTDSTVIVSFHDPESRLEFSHPWPQPVIGGERGNSSFYLANAPQLLDSPGEWYQDYPSGKIYYYPVGGKDPNESMVVAPVLETIVAVEGTPSRMVNDVKFENITFEHAAWLRPSMEGHVTLQGGFRLLDAYKLDVPGLPEKAELENQAWIARPEAAVTVRNSTGIDFSGCRFNHLGATGLDYISGVSESKVSGCTFEDIGGTALQIGTFPDGGFETHVPYIPESDSGICHDITVSDNVICDATNEDWGCVGIGAGYVRDIDITRNEVSHLNYSGICVGWGWTPLESGMRNNRITDNHVHHFGTRLYDTGGIYTLSNQPGSVISGNRIEHLVDSPYATNNRGFYIYFDEATDGFTVENNYCPDAEFGYNRPGPAMVVRNNGPQVIIDKEPK